jgi:hypothetical protein
MKYSSPILFATVVAVSLAARGVATAGPVWSVDWPSGVQMVRLFSPSHNSELDVTFHNARGDNSTPSADVADLQVVRHGPEHLPLGVIREHYNLNLRLTDLASGERELMHFSGYLQITHTRNRIQFSNIFTTPGRLTDLTLGNNIYTVNLGPFDPPGLGGSHVGSLDVTVTFQPIPTGPPATTTTTGPPISGSAPPMSGNDPPSNLQATPEPPSVVLGGIGFGIIGLAGWRMRRSRRND